MPSALPDTGHVETSSIRGGNPEARTRCNKPMVYSGLLDTYAHHDLTPVIGREYHGLQAVDLLKAANSDELIKDLAVTGEDHVWELSDCDD